MFQTGKLSKTEYIRLGTIFWAVVFTAAEAPFTFAFKTDLQNWQLWSDLIISSIFTYDLVDHIKRHRREKKSSMVSSNRWVYWFQITIDAFVCIPFDIIFWMWGLGPAAADIFKIFRMLRLIRIIKIVTILDKLAVVPKWIKFQFSLVSIIIMIHILACFWIYLNPWDGSVDRTTYYIQSFYWTVTTLTTVGYGDITPSTNVARVYTMFVMLGGVGFYGLVIGNISRIFAENARYKEQTREKFSELSAFMKHYHIPDRLQQSVFNYYNHLYSKHLSDNDQKIISELPISLRQDLQVYMNMKLIRNLPVFKQCSQACLKAIATALELKHFGPGETIIKIGEVGDEMYVIGHGVVDIILKDGNVVAQLHEGQFFGENALLTETTRNANVRASTYCDLYKLSKNDFLEIIETYPELLTSMEVTTNRRATDRK
jgi:voltage-gated potassium channel